MTPRLPRHLAMFAGLALAVALANLVIPHARGVQGVSTSAAAHPGDGAFDKLAAKLGADLGTANDRMRASLAGLRSAPMPPPPGALPPRTAPSTAPIPRGGAVAVSSDGASPDQALDLQLVNQTRASMGLAPVSWNPHTSAQDWADRLAATHSQGDDPGFANGPGCAHAGNFAAASSVEEAHKALVASPPHFANMTGNYATVGIGVARDANFTYVVEDYTRPC